MSEKNESQRPTVVLMHGACTESAIWVGVIGHLQAEGYTAVAAANPLRSLLEDAESIASIIESIEGPVILVGHSYGGGVISGAALGKDNVEALVFVAAFAPEKGESIGYLAGLYPGSVIADILTTVPLSDGTNDFYIRREEYHEQFATDVPAAQAALMAATQRPIRDVAVSESAGPPAWKTVPSWFVIPTLDKNLPPEAQRFMAGRAKAQEVVEVEGSSHAVSVSHPDEVADVILAAAGHDGRTAAAATEDAPASRTPESVVYIPAGSGRVLDVLGDQIALSVVGEDTGGELVALEVTVAPGDKSIPHSNPSQGLMRILEGEVEITRMREGELETFVAGPGSLVYTPKNSVRAYHNPGSEPTRFLSVQQPAGHERFLTEISALTDAAGGPPEASEVVAVAEKHGLSFPVEKV